MSFFDDLMSSGLEQYHPEYPYGPTPIPVIPPTPTPTPTPTKGIVTKKKWVFEYSFIYSPTEKAVFVGSKVLEFGSFTWHNAMTFFMDLERRFPVEMSLTAMLETLSFEVDNYNVSLKECLENLQLGESFAWVLYGSYKHPLGDTISDLEILVPDALKSFLTCKVKPTKLRDGSNFKVLFTFTKTKEFLTLKPPYAGFGVKGTGKRMGES